ncbi:hypothetical protein ACHMW6_25935 [Pseudoduganella sp. UC29_106]|uniref:hypothetical protein n=1 Tax=Pseudoduganella sp. UC29_106 TaxID=3374553 RepID=UPI003757DBE1
MMLAISAVDWAKEVPLKELLAREYASQSSLNTEKVIETLQNTVSFGLPALLSPIYAMYAPNSIMLSAMERGAYQPGTIEQINNNVPRETAIAVLKRAKSQGITLNTLPEVVHYLRRTKVQYWSAIQFRHLVPVEDILQ